MEEKMMKSNGVDSRSSAMKRRRLFSAAAVLLICCLVFVGAAGADGVAQIERTGVSYESIQEAVDVAQDEDIIKVIASHCVEDFTNSREFNGGEITYYIGICVSNGKKITIDLNGKKVEFKPENKAMPLLVGGQSKLTIRDGSGGGELKAVSTNLQSDDDDIYSLLCLFDTGSEMLIESGEYIADKVSDSLVYAAVDEAITVQGGTFYLGNLGTGQNGSPWIFNANGQNTKNIIVKGGTFNDDIVHQYYPFEVSVPKEKALVKDPTANIWTIVDDAVAYVNEQEWSSAWYTNEVGYATLEEALEKAGPAKIKSGVTSLIEDVHLLTDYTVEETLNINEDVTINLDEHTLLWNGGVENSIFDVLEEKTLTINKIGDEFKIECVGYEIGGWYTKDAVGNEVSLEASNGKVVTSLYAKQHRANTYTITITANPPEGGEVGASQYEANYRDEITLTSTPDTGYNFKEWEVITDNKDSVSVADSKFSMPADNVTVTAKYVPLQYTVTFNTGGGTSTAGTLIVTYDAKYANLPNAEKEGHTFLYWMHEDGSTVTNETTVSTARNHILTAVFKENSAEGDVAPPSSGGGGDGGALSFPRTTTNGGLVDFGSSKVVKALMLPEGSSGSVLLKVDTVEKWPKALDTEYTFDISVEKLGDGMAYIHFEIPVSALESLELTPADICAYHFEGEVWTKLPTTYEVKDGTVCYEAATDSFSPFKLVIEEGAAVPKEEETVPVIPPTETPDVPDEPEILPPIDEPTKPADEPETPAPILAVLAGLGAAFIVRRK